MFGIDAFGVAQVLLGLRQVGRRQRHVRQADVRHQLVGILLDGLVEGVARDFVAAQLGRDHGAADVEFGALGRELRGAVEGHLRAREIAALLQRQAQQMVGLRIGGLIGDELAGGGFGSGGIAGAQRAQDGLGHGDRIAGMTAGHCSGRAAAHRGRISRGRLPAGARPRSPRRSCAATDRG